MKTSYDLWLRHLEQHALPTQEADKLARQLENPLVLAECMEDRALDQLFRLIATTDQNQDAFAADCVRRFELRAAPKLHAPDLQHLNQPTTSAGSVAMRVIRRRKIRGRTALALLSLASTVVIGCLVIMWPRIPQLANQLEIGDDSMQHLPPTSIPDTGYKQDDPTLPVFGIADLARGDTVSQPSTIADQREIAVEWTDSGQADSGQADSEPHAPIPVPPAAQFVTLQSDHRVQWGHTVPGSRLGAGTLQLETGLAALEFDNRIRMILEGPAEIELVSPNALQVQKGRAWLRVPGDLNRQFEVRSPYAKLFDMSDVQILLYAETLGTEFIISRGRASLKPFDNAPQSEPIQLAQDQMRQVFVSTRTSDDSVPPFWIAQGRNRYLGQVGMDDRVAQTTSPSEFERWLRPTGESFSQLPTDQTSRRLLEMVRQFHHIVKQDDLPAADVSVSETHFESGFVRGYSFQEQIIFDGRRIDVSSGDEVERMMESIQQRFRKND